MIFHIVTVNVNVYEKVMARPATRPDRPEFSKSLMIPSPGLAGWNGIILYNHKS